MAAVASVAFQFLDRSGNPVAAQTIPLDTNGNLPTAQVASEIHLGAVGTEGNHPTGAPVATALTYSTGKCVGGLFPLANFVRIAGRSATILSATLRSKVTMTTPADLVIFRDTPTITTGLTDGATFAVDVTEIAKMSRVISFGTTAAPWVTAGTPSISTIDNIGKYMSLVSGTSALGILVSRGSLTLSTSSDLTVGLGNAQD